MSTDDILDRLYAAFTNPDATRGPQLIADAHTEILRLRAQATRIEDEYRRRHDNLDEAIGIGRNKFARELDAALALMSVRHALDTTQLRADLADARRRAAHDATYRTAVERIPDLVRRHRAVTRGGSDTQILTAAMKSIEKANTARMRALAAQRKHPERMTA